MKNKEWKEAFAERLLEFSVRIIRLCSKLPKIPAGFATANQLIKSAPSIGANFTEAQDASSARDFTQKLNISLREDQESCYWLKVILRSGLIPIDIVQNELTECNEITAVLSKSVKSSKLRIV